jgi:hypothetical protein
MHGIKQFIDVDQSSTSDGSIIIESINVFSTSKNGSKSATMQFNDIDQCSTSENGSGYGMQFVNADPYSTSVNRNGSGYGMQFIDADPYSTSVNSSIYFTYGDHFSTECIIGNMIISNCLSTDIQFTFGLVSSYTDNIYETFGLISSYTGIIYEYFSDVKDMYSTPSWLSFNNIIDKVQHYFNYLIPFPLESFSIRVSWLSLKNTPLKNRYDFHFSFIDMIIESRKDRRKRKNKKMSTHGRLPLRLLSITTYLYFGVNQCHRSTVLIYVPKMKFIRQHGFFEWLHDSIIINCVSFYNWILFDWLYYITACLILLFIKNQKSTIKRYCLHTLLSLVRGLIMLMEKNGELITRLYHVIIFALRKLGKLGKQYSSLVRGLIMLMEKNGELITRLYHVIIFALRKLGKLGKQYSSDSIGDGPTGRSADKSDQLDSSSRKRQEPITYDDTEPPTKRNSYFKNPHTPVGKDKTDARNTAKRDNYKAQQDSLTGEEGLERKAVAKEKRAARQNSLTGEEGLERKAVAKEKRAARQNSLTEEEALNRKAIANEKYVARQNSLTEEEALNRKAIANEKYVARQNSLTEEEALNRKAIAKEKYAARQNSLTEEEALNRKAIAKEKYAAKQNSLTEEEMLTKKAISKEKRAAKDKVRHHANKNSQTEDQKVVAKDSNNKNLKERRLRKESEQKLGFLSPSFYMLE